MLPFPAKRKAVAPGNDARNHGLRVSWIDETFATGKSLTAGDSPEGLSRPADYLPRLM